jgi:hypothetical protein
MADITYCISQDCPLRDRCRRADLPAVGVVDSLAQFVWNRVEWDTTVVLSCRQFMPKARPAVEQYNGHA